MTLCFTSSVLGSIFIEGELEGDDGKSSQRTNGLFFEGRNAAKLGSQKCT